MVDINSDCEDVGVVSVGYEQPAGRDQLTVVGCKFQGQLEPACGPCRGQGNSINYCNKVMLSDYLQKCSFAHSPPAEC